jgi:Mg-chelatase subunit ChlD
MSYKKQIPSSFGFIYPEGKMRWLWAFGNSLFFHASIFSLLGYTLPSFPLSSIPTIEVEYVEHPADGVNDDHGEVDLTLLLDDGKDPLPFASVQEEGKDDFSIDSSRHSFQFEFASYGTESPSGNMRHRSSQEPVAPIDLEQHLGKNARQAPDYCHLYTNQASAPETLYLFVDSSGSIDSRYRAPLTSCSYRAAYSALKQGSSVVVINFSDNAEISETTSDPRKIAEAISLRQGEGTRLPAALDNIIAETRVDVLIVSDGEIINYGEPLPSFKNVLARHPDNKGYFIVVGKGTSLHAVGAIYTYGEAGFTILPSSLHEK